MNYLELLKREPKPLLFASTNAFFSCYGQSHFLALFTAFFLQKYGLTNTQFGSFYAAATLMSAFVLPFLGPIIDRVDVRRYCVGIGLGFLTGFLLLQNTQQMIYLFLALFVLRLCGQGLCMHVNGVSVARYFGMNRGKALAVTNIGFPLAEGLFTPFIASLLLLYAPEEVMWGLMAAVIFIYLPLTLLPTRSQPLFNLPHSSQEMPDQHTAKVDWKPSQVLRHKVFYLLIGHSVFPAFSLSGFLIYQVSLAENKAWPVTTIAFAMIIFAMGRVLSAFVTGPLVDRYGALRLFPYYQVPLSLAFLVFWYFSNPIFAALGMLLSGFTVGAAAPIKSSLWAELYGVKHLGGIKSLFATIIVVVTSISPLVFGWVIDHHQLIQFLLLLSIVSFITALVGGMAIQIYQKSPKNP